MKNHYKRRTRGAVLLGAAALAAGSVGLLATPAFAAPGDAGTGTVTVYKLEQPAGNLGPNDGSQLSTTGATPLVAGFTACTIDDIDLSNSADWVRLKNITVALNGSGSPVVTETPPGTTLTTTCGPEQTTTLAAGGATTFTLPADKAYVVYESTAAANAISVASPTIITVPYPGNGAAGQPVWNYDPHIYPKNIVAGSGSTKDGKIVGDKVTFDINLPIKPLNAGQNYTEVRINDQLAASLKYTSGSVVLKDATGTDVPLAAGDYTLTTPSGNAGDEVILNFTASGLAKIDANIGGNVTLTINADAITTGSTANEAQITINGKGTGPGTGPQVLTPVDYFAGAHIMKEAKNKGATANVPLAGAQFDIYTADAAATSCPATPDSTATRVFTADESNASGETPDRVLAEGQYCVYETKIPSGYKGLNGGMLLTVDSEDDFVSVENTQIGSDAGDLPSLPLTGSTGSALLIGGGITLLAGGGLLLAARRRKEKREQQLN